MTTSPYLSQLDQVAFICGCGHSGTTLLATMFRFHPQIYVPTYESDAFLTTDEVMEQKLAQLQDETLAAGKRYLLEKTPRHVRFMPKMRAVVPNARFVLMVRDGRDVTASITHRFAVGAEYGLERWTIDNGLVLAEVGKPDVFLLRYEDLITRTESSVRATCDFLGVEYVDDLLKYHQHQTLWHGRPVLRRASGVREEHHDYRNWQVNQPIFDGRGRWRRELPRHIAQQLRQGRPAELMAAFGYPQWPWEEWLPSRWFAKP